MQRSQYPTGLSRAMPGKSAMQVSHVLNGSSKRRHEHSPMSQRRYLQSKGPSNDQRQIPPWEKNYSAQKPFPAAPLRDDHPIYHDDYYISHIQLINSLGKRISHLTAWTEQIRGPRTRSRDLLGIVHTDIMKMLGDPSPFNLENRVKVWEFQIQTVGSGYRDNRKDDRMKYGEWKSIKAMMDGVKSGQKYMMKAVIRNMPRFFWKSSAPLKRMLELEKQISRFETLLSEAKKSVVGVLVIDEQISELFTKCNNGLVGVINMMLVKIEGPQPQRGRSGSQTRGNYDISGVLSLQRPLSTVTEESLNKAAMQPQVKH
ncbi:hypothetical protein TWF569_003438 [Orbilia oligospora]|uniref:Uncharacterized protein n=1 Tax=Orbilia oligospora TaxID=2813651 RepID=A0A7C8JCY7_ORBOL|nr:hypothetical protein TWF103_001909 [Orbilia oligospora]KAF3092440.1 hypothetical protein TWF706_009011 [Orbilia oligospora]KAF3105968.1 hypothetical protein TWF102_001869 [Orbilia oligospora]KAF3136817.1 hypothetical protein TWF594_007708 [Orbilia oligospora]KAF3151719.1 hypothetical protein TWF569_003438 [Orbilia oligospora]